MASPLQTSGLNTCVGRIVTDVCIAPAPLNLHRNRAQRVQMFEDVLKGFVDVL
jgi:hypothetical protein